MDIEYIANGSNGGDDSDNDLITDFLGADISDVIFVKGQTSTQACYGAVPLQTNSLKNSVKVLPNNNNNTNALNTRNSAMDYVLNASTFTSAIYSNNLINHQNNNINCNKSNSKSNINNPSYTNTPPIKYHSMFEDTICQLQNIRESILQMKNSTIHVRNNLSGLANSNVFSTSLPDLYATDSNGNGINGTNGRYELPSTFYTNFNIGVCRDIFSQKCHQHFVTHHLLSSIGNRRKSWTAITDLNATPSIGDGYDTANNKSFSFSSLDSEDQEAIRVTEQRRRSARISTGGISTHSLNDADLGGDIECTTNANITHKKFHFGTEPLNHLLLQKSISASSIIDKDEIKSITRHLTDSEEENQSLLRAHMKIEVLDQVEKRRKRSSLFFRKKKDKTKTKALINSQQQVIMCEICGTTLNQLKDHHLECKTKKSQSGFKKFEILCDFYDGAENLSNCNDDTPLIRCEFLYEPIIDAKDLGADATLGIAIKEHDSWSPGVAKDILVCLKEIQIKRQEHIYEFILTEKHHCQTLLVIQKIFIESLQKYFPSLNCNKMFPRLTELIALHTEFLKKLRLKQREHPIVDSIADILLEFFSFDKACQLRLAYGEFCANHRAALEQFKNCFTNSDRNFSIWYKHCLTNPLLKKKGIPECILFVTQRLTKYPLLIEPLLKSAREDKVETDKLQKAMALVKDLLMDVDACVAEKELRERQIDIYNRIDQKSFAIYKNKPFRKTDLGVNSQRCLKFEGWATLMQGRSKMQLVLVVVLTDCLCFLSENSAHNKYLFFTPEQKAGVVPLQKLLIREKAGTESRGIYIISSNPLYPEMYELKIQTPKDKNVWIQTIRQAVLDCLSSDFIKTEYLTAEEKLRVGLNKQEILEKIRQKDIEQAILLEEKLILQMSLFQKNQSQENQESSCVSAADFILKSGSNRDLCVDIDCDTTELWNKVVNTVEEISYLASTVYSAATGQAVSRSISSAGEKQSETYASPILPKRAETFAGFDEKRSKNTNCSNRNIDKLFPIVGMTPRLQELEEKNELRPYNSKSNKDVNKSVNNSSPNNKLMDASWNSDVNEANGATTIINNNLSFFQITQNLHTLFCIISQQMTTIQNLQIELALFRDNPKASYLQNDQLEELRNLQDKLQEEKILWLRQKEQQEEDLNEKKQEANKLKEQLRIEQDDIKQQREQLFRKMEILSSQGLLLSPNTPLIISTPLLQQLQQQKFHNSEADRRDQQSAAYIHRQPIQHEHEVDLSTTPLEMRASSFERRKDKWRTASISLINKPPPFNLLSATNAPKIQQNIVKQKIPMKLSSSSSPVAIISPTMTRKKCEKSSSTNFSNYTTSYVTTFSPSTSANITQIFPLKLADKRLVSLNSNISFSTETPQISQINSPAVIPRQSQIQRSTTATEGNPTSRSERLTNYRQSTGCSNQLHNNIRPTSSRINISIPSQHSDRGIKSQTLFVTGNNRPPSVPVILTMPATPINTTVLPKGNKHNVSQNNNDVHEEEEIYF